MDVSVSIESTTGNKCTRCGKEDDNLILVVKKIDVEYCSVSYDLENLDIYRLGNRQPVAIPNPEPKVNVYIKVKPVAMLCKECAMKTLGDLLILEEL